MSPPADRDVAQLLAIMARLRHPESGCPWDVDQTFETIAPYTLEEAYEVADAIAQGDLEALREELGDLLLQVVYHARMAEEAGRFAFSDVVESICRKLVSRHPHVFGDAEVADAEEQTRHWEEHKRAERARRAARSGRTASAFDDLPRALPALVRARKLQGRARRLAAPGQPSDHAAAAGSRSAAPATPESPDAPVASLCERWLSGDDAALGPLLAACVERAAARGLDAETVLRDWNRREEARWRALERGETGGGEPSG